MKLELVWSVEASDSFEKLLDEMGDQFSEKEVNQFIVKTYHILSSLQTYPRLYKSSGKLTMVHRAIIHKHTGMIYQVNKCSIRLLLFWDNRRDPKELSII